MDSLRQYNGQWGAGQFSRARQHSYEPLRTHAETEGLTWLVEPLPAMALLLAVRDEKERAVELYASASRSPIVANSRWYEDVFGRHIPAVAATLPPEVVATAQDRGRARDLWTTAEELLVELEDAKNVPP